MKRLALLLLFGGVALGATRYIDTITTYVNDFITINRNELRLGDNTTGTDKKITANNGEANEPYLFYDESANKWKKSDDGTIEKALGTGSGVGGENYNNAFTDTQNADAEDGTGSWTASAGTFANETTDPLAGDRSFNWTPNAQNDTLDSATLDLDKQIFHGRACQASIVYIGGDDNLTLSVEDADGDVLASEEFEAASIAQVKSLFFLCPDSGATANDLDLTLRIENTGASASAQITFDSAYVGTLIGLSETTLPDLFSATVSDTGVVNSENVDWINGNCAVTDSSLFTCTFNSGVFPSEAPSCQVVVESNITTADVIAKINAAPTTSSVVVRTSGSDATTNFAKNPEPFHIYCQKQGADAKQSVQVYKSIPKVAQNENEFSAIMDASFNITSENVDWIDGNCTNNATGDTTCNFVSGTFSNTPTCVGTAEDSAGGGRVVSIRTISSSSVRFYTTNVTPTGQDDILHIKCSKQGDDYKTPTVQPVIVGQVENSYATSSSKVMVHNACETNNNSGTPETNSDYCDSWISSITDSGTGDYTFNFVSGSFSTAPVCVCSTRGAGGIARVCLIQSASTSSIRTLIYDADDGVSSADEDVMLICTGEK